MRLAILLAAAAPIGCDDDAGRSEAIGLPAAEKLVAVELELLDQNRTVVSTSRTTDPAAVARLVQIIAGADPIRPHKCAHVGRLILRCTNEKAVEIQLLPGHGHERIEVRQGDRYYAAPRQAMIESLRAAGLDDWPHPPA